jgi:hypothetical protein
MDRLVALGNNPVKSPVRGPGLHGRAEPAVQKASPVRNELREPLHMSRRKRDLSGRAFDQFPNILDLPDGNPGLAGTLVFSEMQIMQMQLAFALCRLPRRIKCCIMHLVSQPRGPQLFGGAFTLDAWFTGSSHRLSAERESCIMQLRLGQVMWGFPVTGPRAPFGCVRRLCLRCTNAKYWRMLDVPLLPSEADFTEYWIGETDEDTTM